MYATCFFHSERQGYGIPSRYYEVQQKAGLESLDGRSSTASALATRRRAPHIHQESIIGTDNKQVQPLLLQPRAWGSFASPATTILDFISWTCSDPSPVALSPTPQRGLSIVVPGACASLEAEMLDLGRRPWLEIVLAIDDAPQIRTGDLSHTCSLPQQRRVEAVGQYSTLQASLSSSGFPG